VRVPLSWLRDFAPFGTDTAALAATLDDLGLVVESVEQVGEGLGDVLVAKVVAIDAIEGADKIRKVTVDSGGGPTEVVCGAWNFEVGDLVPFAPVGAVLPGGFEISRRTMRGVVSNGMLCSGAELRLSDDAGGLLILGRDGTGPAPGAAPGTPLVEALGIEADTVFDLAIEANRPDAWSVAGVARDLAARLRLPFGLPEPTTVPVGEEEVGALASVVVEDPDLCPRFTARVLTGVRVAPSPQWMARRLTLAGMRPINNVVDASNYVMLELGQPTHPYDLDRLAGAGVRVRAARPGEQVVTLDGVLRTAGTRAVGPGDDRRDCLICDATGSPVGIGGIMGGAGTEITTTTTRVLLEAAYFDPMAIARSAKRFGLRTEASARFERGCDPDGIDRAASRLVALLAQTAGPAYRLAPGVLDLRGPVPEPTRVQVRTERVNAILGTDLDDGDIAGYLEPIGFTCERPGPGLLSVTVPSFRPDTAREIDVIEEVARHHGYSNLPRRRPFTTQVGRLTPYQRERRLVREVVAGLGAHEAWTTSLLAPQDLTRARLTDPPAAIEIENPLTPDESVLRTSLLPGLMRALAYNADRRHGELRLFEIGRVFPPPAPERVERALGHEDPACSVVDERELLGVALAHDGDDARRAVAAWEVLADALGVIEVEVRALAPGDPLGAGLHPTRSALLVAVGAQESAVVGQVGEVDPEVLEAFGLAQAHQRVGWLQVDLGVLLRDVARRSPLLAPVSRFPSSDVDLAFVVADDVPAAEVRRVLVAAAGELLETVTLFDVYRGPGVEAGARSLAFRLRFCAPDRTLTDREVGQLRAACITAVERATGARLRGE